MMNILPASFPIAKMIRFGVVGCVGVVVDFSVTFLLKEKLRFNKYVANGIGFCLAATGNYFLNRIWTFQNTDPNIVLQYGKFIMISVVGMALANSIVWILYEKFKLNFYVAKGFSIVIVMCWNFVLNAFYTFG